MNIRELLDKLTPEQIESGNRMQFEENERVYKEFSLAYQEGMCSLCGKSLNSFNKENTCFHWFLYPNGIKKKYFKEYLKQPIGFFKFDSYIRWMANLDAPLININDLKDEMNPAKIIEYTVRYKNIEWSVNIGKGEMTGHKGSKNADFPHFHIQMKVGDTIFIRFNDFHIPLSREDIFYLKSLEENPDIFVWDNDYGEGMSILEKEYMLKELDGIMNIADGENSAIFNTSSFIQMPEGKTMSLEILNEIFTKSQESKEPVRHLIKNFYPEAHIVTEVRPGENLPEIKTRNKRK